jgi:hypothetical protein
MFDGTDLLDIAPDDDGLASPSTFFLSLEPLNPRLDLTYSHDKPSALQRPHFLSPSHLRCLVLQGMQATATAALLVGAESPVCLWMYLRPVMETGSGRGESGRSYMSRSPSGESSGGVWSGRLLAMMSASQLRDGGLWKALRICDEETGALNKQATKQQRVRTSSATLSRWNGPESGICHTCEVSGSSSTDGRGSIHRRWCYGLEGIGLGGGGTDLQRRESRRRWRLRMIRREAGKRLNRASRSRRVRGQINGHIAGGQTFQRPGRIDGGRESAEVGRVRPKPCFRGHKHKTRLTNKQSRRRGNDKAGRPLRYDAGPASRHDDSERPQQQPR